MMAGEEGEGRDGCGGDEGRGKERRRKHECLCSTTIHVFLHPRVLVNEDLPCHRRTRYLYS
ncbi:hypothetical protein Pcinc_008467 [Petrolisthes cinctipes]|uniref:Uncharacterized protein n=1 Tax=Petrolisthes cinctipes TaxID=88211 RepID=A0AAE1G970_PETCI|nr:hypothetical protein Pcinc_008467 [Petrolisthes cinctipes]